MAIPINPTRANWVNPTQAKDANGAVVPWDPTTDFGGIQLVLDGTPAVSVPAQAAITTFDLTSLAAYQALPVGSHTLGLAVTTKEGVSSAFSPPVTFLRAVVPLAPTAVVLA